MVLFAVVHFRMATYGMDRLYALVQSFVPSSDNGIEIGIDSVNSTVMRSIEIDGIHLKAGGHDVVDIQKVEVSLSLFDVLRLALGGRFSVIEASISDVRVLVTSDNVKALSEVISSLSAPSGQQNDTDDARKVNNPNPFTGFGLSVTLKDLDVYVDFNGITAVSEGSYATAKLSKGFVLESADLNIPSISTGEVGPADISVSDIRLSVDRDLSIYGSIGSVGYGSFARLYDLSAIAQIVDGVLSTALYMQSARGQIVDEDFSAKAQLESSTARLDYGYRDRLLSFSLASENIMIDSADPAISVRLSNTELGGQFDGTDDLSLMIVAPEIGVGAFGSAFNLNGISADIDLALGSFSSMGQILLDSVSVSGFDNLIVSEASLKSFVMDYSYSSAGLGIRVRSSASGSSPNSYIGQFSGNLDVSAQTRDFRSVSTASVNLKNLRFASLRDDASLTLDMSESGIMSGSFSISGDISSNVSLDLGSENLDIRLYLNGLKPYSYPVISEILLANIPYVDQKTMLEGSVVLSAQLTDSFSSWLSDILSGEYGSRFEFASAFDAVSATRVSFNTAVSDVNVSDSILSGAMTLDAVVDRDVAQISNFAVTAAGLRVSFSGGIDMREFLPDGRLALQKASDGSELASILFQYRRGERIYEFLGQTPLEPSLKVDGTLNWENLQRIVADASISTKYLPPEGLGFEATITPNPLMVDLAGDHLNLNVNMDNDRINVAGSISDLIVNASEDMAIVVDSKIGGFYNPTDGSYGASLQNLFVKVSDMLDVGLDLMVTDHSVKVEHLVVGRGLSRTVFDGVVDFGFESIPKIISGDTSSLRGTIDLESSTGDYAKVSVTDDQYYADIRIDGYGESILDARLGVLGKRSSGFYGSSYIQWGEHSDNRIDLNAVYQNKVLSLYDTSGNIGSLKLDGISFKIDFSKMVLDASLDFLNERVFSSGETKSQMGTVTLDAKVEGLSNSLFQLFAGLDYEIVFNLGLSNVVLADGFRVADTTAEMVFHNGLLTFKGDLINGSYDIRNNYIDMGIDRKLLFGLDVKGHVGKNLDLMVSNVYFPIRILNQIMDSTMFAFEDGFVEGDILISGPANNPGFYGMAYCQSFGMSMFYLPDQMISLKNVSISLQDHNFIMSKSSMTGYSNLDGRYFYGNVSLEVIMQGLGLQTMDLKVDIDDNYPVDFWLPYTFGNMDFEVRGDITGFVEFKIDNGNLSLATDVTASSTLIDFKLGEMPQWFYKESEGANFNMDIAIRTGKDIEFCYPEKDNSFLNFTLSEGETVKLKLSDGVFSTDGGLAVKTGQVYYFHNDFIITEGSVDLSQKKYNSSNSALPFILNLNAELTDYDANGKKVIIDLILKDATLDNISPRFTSTPAMSQNEILSLLGQSVLSSSSLDSQVSVASLASFAATAADALTRVGVIESNSSYSIASTIRNSLNLDIFSARSNIISNVIVDALPGELAGRGDVSMLARYLDGTSLYAGKYLGSDMFLRLTLMLKADSSNSLSDDVGHFLAKDLILDTELSMDWNNPMGTFTIFTQPHELSVFDILDTIGFSVTKQIQF